MVLYLLLKRKERFAIELLNKWGRLWKKFIRSGLVDRSGSRRLPGRSVVHRPPSGTRPAAAQINGFQLQL
ncbi:hypothetical protein SporoS204_11840 [Sporosarcina ureae]|uniref:Uncharacterized protein n=1 Tax=Sporosarcina ureae TaxID=1571 RepID=A0ABM6JXT8_SPOUR|nr:hypothetical protein SporoS204_11840 [Sporosarcina ureae]